MYNHVKAGGLYDWAKEKIELADTYNRGQN